MTAWHDRQPLSRRQVRNSQREAEADAVFSAARIQTEEAPFGFSNTLPEGAGGDDSDRFDSAETPTVSNPIVPGGRRAQRLAAGAASQDEGSFRVREFRPREDSDAADDSAAESSDSALHFATPARPSMPEGLPSALAFLPSATSATAEDTQAVDSPVTPLGGDDPVAPAPEATADGEVPAGRPLTRRELRALEAARESAEAETEPAEPGPSFAPILFTPAADATDEAVAGIHEESVAPVVNTPAPAASAFAAPVFDAPVFDAPVFDAPVFDAPASDAPAFDPSAFSQANPLGQKFDLSAPPESPIALGDLAPPTGVPLGTSPTELPTLADLLAPSEPTADSGDAPAAFVPQFSLADYPAPTALNDAIASDRGVDVIAAPHTAPVGHWTMQQAIDDVTQGSTAPTSRDLSTATGPITSSALVLPSIPDGADLSVPFATATGEVLITGSISLPSTLGTTGAHPARYDHSDLDAIIDAADRDDIEGDSAPVRAIRAVSTHTSPRDVISMSRKSEGNRLPIVLAITAGAMMVSVTVLVVVGFVFGTF